MCHTALALIQTAVSKSSPCYCILNLLSASLLCFNCALLPVIFIFFFERHSIACNLELGAETGGAVSGCTLHCIQCCCQSVDM
jgi:hypothetical protein